MQFIHICLYSDFYTSNALFGQNTKQNQKYKALCYIWWSHIQYI